MLALGIGIGANFSAATAAEPERAPSGYSRYQKLDMFARALSIIEQHYVRPVDDTQLVYAAIQGLVSELDPHTGFLPPREAKLLREDIEGAFGGVGMVVVLGREADGKRYLDVRDVIADGPAHKAGIRVGYHIVAIDGQAITQFPDLEQAIVTIRGRPGTKLSVTIKDPEREVLRAITLTREIIEPPAVEVRYMGEGLGLLRLREFAEDATQEVIDGLDTMAKEAGRLGLRGIVLDLRDNGGGLLGEAIGIADVFIEEGAIVRTRGRQGVVLDEARARRPGTHHDLPLVVLVNKGSASASEIVAGALQDHGRALLVGERTYGKGSVQAPFTLRDGSMLKLTTALYYTPSDRLIQASGVAPDVFVGASQEEGLPNLDSRPEIDPERIQPRHLRPEDFGRKTPSISDETPALQAAGDDLQLRTAVQHLYAWSRLRLTNRIKTGR
jgi:carboxyl-terminal processing protease